MTLPPDSDLEIDDDGLDPVPSFKDGSNTTARTVVSALRVAASAHTSKGNDTQAILHLESVIAIGSALV